MVNTAKHKQSITTPLAKDMNELQRSKGIVAGMILGLAAGYEHFYRAVGGIWCSRLGMTTFILAAILVPVASLLPHNRPAVLCELFFAMAVNSAADLAAYSGSNVLVGISSLLACNVYPIQAAKIDALHDLCVHAQTYC